MIPTLSPKSHRVECDYNASRGGGGDAVPFFATTTLPSFPSLRERNLRTLYGYGNDDNDDVTEKIGDYDRAAAAGARDKSPKGNVDEKIRPLVDVINRHPEYVTLSSCSGRVALFDPGGDRDGGEGATADDDDAAGDGEGGEETHPPPPGRRAKGTESSGKGRGRWIFVTHEILPDLGRRIVESLHTAGRERLDRRTTTEGTMSDGAPPPLPWSFATTLKHEPPLLHVAASSLDAGKRLLHLAKSTCAMRESGLVVTDRRVTVELRTTGTALCLPVTVALSTSSGKSVTLSPDECYLMSLADAANERMSRNEALLEKLFAAVRDELFEESMSENSTIDRRKDTAMTNTEEDDEKYKVILRPLPPLNLWKSAAVVIPRSGRAGSKDDDLDVLVFGGQGIGPEVEMDGISWGKAPTSKRWDAVFRLARRDGIWSNHWDIMPTSSANELTNNKTSSGNHEGDLDESTEITIATNGGKFQVQTSHGLGLREGHGACVLPPSKIASAGTMDRDRPRATVLFGGRVGGPTSPSDDLFLFALCVNHCTRKETAMLGRPLHVRGAPPEPRFGHSMVALRGDDYVGSSLSRGEQAVAVVAGGTGVPTSGGAEAVSLSSVHILSRSVDDDALGLSHFVWSRISDMPGPRTYHAAVVAPEKRGSDCIYVFGGVVDAGDPIGSFGNVVNRGATTNDRSWFALSLFGASAVTQHSNNGSNAKLPLLIGSGAAAVPLKSGGVVLYLGGTKSPTNSDLGIDEWGPLTILKFKSNEDETANGIIRLRISAIKLVSAESKEGNSSDVIDFGSCVHHSLMLLPKEIGVEPCGDTASAIVVGGGVPSFSFGQSYTPSYLINLTRVATQAASSKHSQDQMNSRQLKGGLISATTRSREPAKTANGKQPSLVRVDVIYVPALHAKEVKKELESLGFLDKRYKMVKVEKMSSDGKDTDGDEITYEGECLGNLIAVPVTGKYADWASAPNARTQGLKHSFQGRVVGRGVEIVPFSSSFMGKMKQKKRLPESSSAAQSS